MSCYKLLNVTLLLTYFNGSSFIHSSQIEIERRMTAQVEDIHTALTFTDLTTVHYLHTDPYGLVNAYITLIPIAIAVGAITLFIFRRDLRTAAVFAGLVFSESVNYVLKKTIKENRPDAYDGLIKGKHSYGMPSSHSQFMFFFSTLVTLFIIKNRINFKHSTSLLTIPFLYTVSAMVAYSRYHLYYHTLKQVLFGSLVGISLGPIWYFVIEFILVPYIFPIVINNPIGRYFYLRDTSSIHNLMEFEYTNATKEIQRLKNTKKNK
ncbi:dolichyldiphosphatase 1 [Cavenderia fasciculata]|uniref:Dolichyldiphosphatase n=1 Tax=Cavenderia fasciculata TaxID=261658 RepID=F4PU72_CACFS|nr:dolichyldiphosphatase 1 [Cavenderia fasciculata]EGG20998.1 dolichyldiphosphatase 1 [Cavenderia fasciculata]|eukprot:XP_004358848.1 dolichyldiphosphatase 1 [Cavenderia fasciculata]